MEKLHYYKLALITFAVIVVIELVLFGILFIFEPAWPAVWHYFAIFIDLMIIGAVFFKERAIWEINQGLSWVYPPSTKLLTDHLMNVSLILIVIMIGSYVLHFFHFFQNWLSWLKPEFHRLVGWPALVSGIIQLILTIGCALLRHDHRRRLNKYRHLKS